MSRTTTGSDSGVHALPVLDESVMIARVVQDNLALAIGEMRAMAERASGSAPATSHRVERSLVSILGGQRMVGELIDLAYIEAGRFALRREPTDLSELLIETVDQCVLPIQRRCVQIDARRSTRCRLDRERVARVIGSFLQAAITYAYPSSPIVIRIEEQDHRACVMMTDVGPGLTAGQSRAIFERRQPSTPRGPAIGLYVSRRIIEAHGGVVGIDTVPSIGTTFYFRLPAML